MQSNFGTFSESWSTENSSGSFHKHEAWQIKPVAVESGRDVKDNGFTCICIEHMICNRGFKNAPCRCENAGSGVIGSANVDGWWRQFQ